VGLRRDVHPAIVDRPDLARPGLWLVALRVAARRGNAEEGPPAPASGQTGAAGPVTISTMSTGGLGNSRYRYARLARLAAGGVVLAGCGGAASGSSGQKVQLSLVASSTPQQAYEQIIQAFQRTPQGRNVTFTKSFGGSGDQSRAVAAGLPADIVAFSLQPDMTRLVKAKIVAEDWDKGRDKGMITDSVVVIGVRKGNPKGIRTWEDLVKPGVEVITPNPFTSGGARWNVLAAYGAASGKGTAGQAGVDYLNRLFTNVPVQDDSARK